MQKMAKLKMKKIDLRAKIKLLLIHQAAKTIVYILHGGDKLYPAVTAVQALEILEKYAPEKSSLTDMLSGRKEV